VKYRRDAHRIVGQALQALDGVFLADAHCFFGGGTYLSLHLGEYRVSRDIDFLCSSRAGFRTLRETVTQRSLGAIVRESVVLARDVRADRDGIRTFIEISGARVKFEILLEGRIDLAGHVDRALGLPVLAPAHSVAEKLLANADRGLDESTLSRDLIDLAFAAVHFGKPTLIEGLNVAEQAYGAAVRRYLGLALDLFQKNRGRAGVCIESLAVEDTTTLRKGLRVLRAL
jgi:hypothetical protein